MPQPRRQPPQQQPGIPPEAYLAAAGGALGARVAGEPPDSPDSAAREALILLILARVAQYVRVARARRMQVIRERVAVAAGAEADIREVMELEADAETAYAQKQKERIRRELATIAAIPDARERAEAVRRLMRQERRIDRQRDEMGAARAYAAVQRLELRRTSPAGAYWRLGERATHCPICLFMAGRFWPWEVLDLVHPPVHPNCACELYGYGSALAMGFIGPGDVPDKADAIRLASGVVLEGEEVAELQLDLMLAEGAVGPLLEAAFKSFDWNPSLHPRDNLGRFVEAIGGLVPSAAGGKTKAVGLGEKTRVGKDKDGTYRVVRSGQIIKGFRTPQDAGLAAVDRAAKAGELPNSHGVYSKYKDFDTFLKTDKQADPNDAWLSRIPGTSVSGVAPKGAIQLEIDRLNGEIAELALVGDKYEVRRLPTLKKRVANLERKVKKAPDVPGGLPPVDAPEKPPLLQKLEGIKPGDTVAWEVAGGLKLEGEVTQGGVEYPEGHVEVKVTKSDAPSSIIYGVGNLMAPHVDVLKKVEGLPAAEHPDVTAAKKKNHIAFAQVADSLSQQAPGALKKWTADGKEWSAWKTAGEDGSGDVYSIKQVGQSGTTVFAEEHARHRAAAFLVQQGAEGTGAVYTPSAGMPVAAVAQTKPPPAPPKPVEPDEAWGGLPTNQQLATMLTKLQASNFKLLSSTERTAIGSYTASGYQAINQQLRDQEKVGDAAIEEKVAEMDSAFEKMAGMSEDVLIWRGISASKLEKFVQNYQNAEVGQVIRDNGFISTSVSESTAKSWGSGIVLKIRWPKGAKGLWVSAPGEALSSQGAGEREMILPRGVGFKIIAKRKVSDYMTELAVEPISGHRS